MRRYFLLLITLLFVLVACQQEDASQIRPIRPVPTPGTTYFSSNATPVAFAEIAAAPRDFQNQLIRVTGNFAAQTPQKCLPFKGPRIEWALIDSDLQMNIVGFEKVVKLLPEGYPVTVEGVWRLYRGPLGCGKEPAVASLWYLDVLKIVQPNPISAALIGVDDRDEPDSEVVPGTEPTATPMTELPEEGVTPTPTATATASPTPTATATLIATLTATPTATPIDGTATTPGVTVPAITPTPDPLVTPTVPTDETPGTPDPNATSTPIPGATEILPPPIGTATPDPNASATPTLYPGESTPTPTPTPTSTPASYD